MGKAMLIKSRAQNDSGIELEQLMIILMVNCS